MQSDLLGGITWPSPSEARFWDRAPRTSPAPISGGTAAAPVQELDADPMHIVHITAEMAPIAKVGGLGDVVTGLSRSVGARGHNVSVIMPFYESLPVDQIEGLKHEMDLDVPRGEQRDGEMRIGR